MISIFFLLKKPFSALSVSNNQQKQIYVKLLTLSEQSNPSPKKILAPQLAKNSANKGYCSQHPQQSPNSPTKVTSHKDHMFLLLSAMQSNQIWDQSIHLCCISSFKLAASMSNPQLLVYKNSICAPHPFSSTLFKILDFLSSRITDTLSSWFQMMCPKALCWIKETLIECNYP